MPLSQRLSLKLQQKLILTQNLQLAIKLLQMTRLELKDVVEQELLANPALETEEEPVENRETMPEAREEEEVRVEDVLGEKIDVKSYFDDLDEFEMRSRFSSNYESIDEDVPTFDSFTAKPERLSDHLRWQVPLALDEDEQPVAEAIIGNINDDGYLSATIGEICDIGKFDEKTVEKVLVKVQRFDPVGVGARDLRECLIIQLDVLGLSDSPAAAIVKDFLNLLESTDLEEIAKRVGMDIDTFKSALLVIRGLEPKPGRKYISKPTQYAIPDVIVQEDGEDLRISLNDDGLPKLRISKYYRNLFENQGEVEDKETLAFIKDRFRSAFWFIKSLDERQRTIYKVADQILSVQKEFFKYGQNALKPLRLKDVAEKVGVHESTISRVVSNKYMDTPRGVYPMRFFFRSGVSTSSGEDITVSNVKEEIKVLVEAEQGNSPLSDQKIVEILKSKGVNLARRTVTKYREEMGLLSSSKRRKK